MKALLNERGDHWRERIAAAFRHFGGLPSVLLGDNARALVVGRDRATGTVSFHPAYLAFCRDWDAQPRACAPNRARTNRIIVTSSCGGSRLAWRYGRRLRSVKAWTAAILVAVEDLVAGFA